MNIRIALIHLFVFLFATFSSAQLLTQAGGQGFSLGTSIALDSKGNIVSSGIYFRDVILGADTLENNGNWDGFIVKYDSLGEFLWSNKIANLAPDNSTKFTTINDVQVDDFDNVLITGDYQEGARFSGTDITTSFDSSNFFLAKYTSSGDFSWVIESTLLTSNASAKGYGLSHDTKGNLYCLGTFRDSVQFGIDTLYSKNTDFFLVKYDSLGSYISSIQSDSSRANGISIDRDALNNIYITGTFRDTLTFNGATTPSLAVNEATVFVKKLDENLTEQWSLLERLDTVLSVSVNQSDELYISGRFVDSSVVNFPNDTLVSVANSSDLILKYDATGNYQWHQEVITNGDTETQRRNNVFSDDFGNVFLSGVFGRESPGVGSVSINGNTKNGEYNEDSYMAKFDTMGNLVWLQVTGDTLIDAINDVVAKDGEHAYVTGTYFRKVAFGNSVLENQVGLKAFFAEIDPCPELEVSILLPLETEVCANQTIQLEASTTTGVNFQWYLNDNLLTGETNTTLITDSTGDYSVLVNDGGQCEKLSFDQSLIFNPMPEDSAITLSDSTLLCDGEILNISLDYKPDYIYRWYFNNILSTADTTSIYRDTIAGDVYAEIETASGCIATTETVTSTFLGTPTTDFTLTGSLDFCEGDSVTFSIPSLTDHMYQWTFNDDSLVGATQTTLVAKDAGDYAIIVSNEADCQATSDDTTVVTISSPASPIEALGATTFCDGEQVLIVTDQFLGLSFQWFDNDVEIVTEVDNTLTATTSGIYKVRVTNGNDCFSTSDEIEVTVFNNPTSEITALSSTSICEDEEVVLDANVVLNATYKWIKDSEELASETGSSISAKESGFYSVEIEDENNCTATSEKELVIVTILPDAVLTALDDTIICQEDSVHLQANIGSDLTYRWFLNGTEIPLATERNFYAKETGQFYVETENASGCTQTSDSANVNVFLPPVSSINVLGDLEFCAGDSVLLQLESNAVYKYQWYKNGFAIPDETNSNFYAKSSGDYTGEIAIDANCLDLSSEVTVVANTNDRPDVTKNGITVSTSNYVSYQWYLDDVLISGATEQILNAQENGVYTVEIENANGCTNRSEGVVVCTPAPEIEASGNKLTSNGGLGYQWYFEDILIPDSEDQFHFAQTSGSYKVLLTDSLNCTSFSDTILLCLPLPTITNFGGGLLSASVGDSYQWYFEGDALPGATTINYVASAVGYYSVEITLNGCKSLTDEILVIQTGVEDDFASSVYFYPNPVQGELSIECDLCKQDDQMIVFNQLGQKVLAIPFQEIISLESFSAGIYTVTIQTDKGVVTHKVSKE